MSTDKETLNVYDAKAEEYANLVVDTQDTQLTDFMAKLPSGARVLDLGCGPGAAAGKMAKAGMTVDATDASPGMVELAQKQPGVTVWQATFDEITGDAIYDGIWANFSLLHAERSDMPRHLAALRTALKPEGLFHIGMKSGTGAKRDGIGRYYTFYTVEELKGLVSTAGFDPIATQTGEEVGLAGTKDPWVTILCRG
jgi:SAM-dependent methyltransferase